MRAKKKKTAQAEDEAGAEAMQRTIIVMFALVDGETNLVSFPMRPLFIKDGKIVPADDQGASDPPESAFHSDLFAAEQQGGHICKWQDGVKICPPHP